MKPLLAFGGFAHDPQSILTAVYGLALMGVELCLNIGVLELSIAPFAHAKALFYDPQFALCHDPSLAHWRGEA